MRKVIIGLVGMLLLSQILLGISSGGSGNTLNSEAESRHSGDTIIAGSGTTPTIDGTISNNEWSDCNYNVVNANGTFLTFYYKHDGTNLYIASQCNVTNMCELYFDLNNDGGANPKTDDILLHASAALYEKPGTGSGWSSSQSSASGWTANTGFGFVREWSITFAKLGIISGNAKTVGVAFSIMMSGNTGFFPQTGSKYNPGTWADLSSSDNWGGGGPVNKIPHLSGGLVAPQSGLSTGNFTFNVTYLDLDDDEPTQKKIYIDGTGYDMSSTDTTYDDGSNFIYSTKLTAGDHKFYFMFNDSKIGVRLPPTGEFDGPNVIVPNSPPSLLFGGIQNNTYAIDEDSGAGDNLIDLEYYFDDDRDDGNLSFEIIFEEDNTKLDATVDGRYLDFVQVEKNWFGTLEFRVSAEDRGYDGVSGGDEDLKRSSNPFTVAVNPVDDPAVITHIGTNVVSSSGEVELLGSGGAMEDKWFNFTITASDADIDMGADDAFVFGSNSTKIKVENDEEDKNIARASMFPTNEDVGRLFVQFSVSDSTGSEIDDYVNVTIDIRNANDEPEIIFVDQAEEKVEITDKSIQFTGSYSAIEEEWFNLTVVAEDPDIAIGIDDELIFGINTTMDNLMLDSRTGELSFLPTQEDVGITYVKIFVMDDADLSWDDYLDLLIEVRNKNDPPGKVFVTSETGLFTFKEGQYANFSATASDADLGYDANEKLSFEWKSDIDGKIGNSERLSTTTLSPAIHNITLTVSDNYGEKSVVLFKVTILMQTTDDGPGPVDDKDDKTQVPDEKEKSTSYLWLIAIVTVVVVVLVLFFVFMKQKKKTEPTDAFSQQAQEQTNAQVPQQIPGQVPEQYPNGQTGDYFTASPQIAQPQQASVPQQFAYTAQPQLPPPGPVFEQTVQQESMYPQSQTELSPSPPQTTVQQEQMQSYPCPTCGQALTYIQESNGYFCNQCQRYA